MDLNLILQIVTGLGGIAGFISLWQIWRDHNARPKLKIEFVPERDLKQWNISGDIRKVFTVHVSNIGKNVAKNCEAYVEILGPSEKTLNLLPLHWADTDYRSLSASMEPVDIRKFPRRLDVAFTVQRMNTPGSWIASSQALGMPQMDQFYHVPGTFDLKVVVTCTNGDSGTLNFKLSSPIRWTELHAVQT